MLPGQVNPLGLLIRPEIQEMSLNNIHTADMNLNNLMFTKSTFNSMKSNSSGYYQNRIRREENHINPEVYVKENDKNLEIVKMVNIVYINIEHNFYNIKNNLF